jgi:hypothetical protein
MSHTMSPSTQRPYGVVRVCQEWGLSRSTCYQQRTRAKAPPATPAKRGPKTSYTDEVLTGHIRQVLATSPFLWEGHRRVRPGNRHSYIDGHDHAAPVGPSQCRRRRRRTAGARLRRLISSIRSGSVDSLDKTSTTSEPSG